MAKPDPDPERSRPLKETARAVLTHALLLPFWSLFGDGQATVFMLHRFSDPETGAAGHDPIQLAKQLAFLRRNRYHILSLSDLVSDLGTGSPGRLRRVAFTVDDGYADFARIGAPVFAQYDCPVTLFVVTGVVDGLCWFWWDRLHYAFEHTARREVEIEIEGERWSSSWSALQERRQLEARLIERLKWVDESAKLSLIDRIAADLAVELPSHPPPKYAPITWRDTKTLAPQGVDFGAHTVTHPVLSRTSDEQCRFEIAESFRRVKQETDAVTEIFCYPNGDSRSFGDRECQVLADVGAAGAVTAIEGFPTEQHGPRGVDARRYRIPRYPLPGTHAEFVQVVSGLEASLQAFRSHIA